MLKNIVAIALGGAMGSALRYGITLGLAHPSYPYATLFINMLGSLALGLIAGGYSSKLHKEWQRLGLGVGFCGGFTTMSTFTAEFWSLFQLQSALAAIGYAFFSVLGCLLFAACGMIGGQKIKDMLLRNAEKVVQARLKIDQTDQEGS